MEEASPRPRALSSELRRLGTGGEHDRLDLRLVLRVLLRCLPLLHDVRRHLWLLGASLLVLLVLGLPFGFLIPDIFWTRVLEGQPLTAVEARLLALDAEPYTVGSSYGVGERQVVRDRWLILVSAFALIGVPLGAALLYYALWILQRINQILRVQLLERLQALSLRFHSDARIGDAIYRIYQDSAQVTAVIEMLFLRPAQFLLTFLVGFAFVLLMSPVLAVGLLFLWAPALWLARRFSSDLRVRFRRAREANSLLTSRIQETMVGIRVIKAYGAEALEQRRFETASRQAFDTAFGARYRLALFGVLAFTLMGTALLGAQARVAWLARDQAPLFAAGFLGFTVFNLGLFSAARTRLGSGTNAIEALLRFWGRAQDIAIGLDRSFEVLDLEPEVRDAPDAIDLPPFEKQITFRDVCFSYVAGDPVLQDITLEARAGTVTAIVGPTGSGKSTLMALLLRLFDPDRGAIEIDGTDLRRIRTQSLRATVAIALQENLLFAATARENLRFAVPDATDEQVEEAARVACADEFIRALPHAYDTLLGERGTKLSTGQRQRLSIARALLKDAPILILDEPTSALDAETERALLANLEEWGRGRAIFLITHRLSTIRAAHQIALLANGRLPEVGSHEELMARPGGAYRAMVEQEARGLPADEGTP
jgi:ABC-type multidrug transport system fused ATPase/permease subunit